MKKHSRELLKLIKQCEDMKGLGVKTIHLSGHLFDILKHSMPYSEKQGIAGDSYPWRGVVVKRVSADD